MLYAGLLLLLPALRPPQARDDKLLECCEQLLGEVKTGYEDAKSEGSAPGFTFNAVLNMTPGISPASATH